MNLISKSELFLLEEIIKKNFAAKYKDSVLGILWSLLKPLLMMIVLTIVFSTLFSGSVDNYPVYLLSARCIYDFFSGAIAISMMAIKGNKNILKRTPAPKYIFVLGSVISEFLNFLISLIILMGVMIVTNATFYFSIMPFAFIPCISILMMVAGLSFMLSIFCVYYSDVQHFWGIVSMIVMYASAIFYPMEIIPDQYKSFLLLNPVFWIIDQFRKFIYQGTFPDLLNIINALLISLIILVIGIIIFKKYEQRILIKL